MVSSLEVRTQKKSLLVWTAPNVVTAVINSNEETQIDTVITSHNIYSHKLVNINIISISAKEIQ